MKKLILIPMTLFLSACGITTGGVSSAGNVVYLAECLHRSEDLPDVLNNIEDPTQCDFLTPRTREGVLKNNDKLVN